MSVTEFVSGIVEFFRRLPICRVQDSVGIVLAVHRLSEAGPEKCSIQQLFMQTKLERGRNSLFCAKKGKTNTCSICVFSWLSAVPCI